MMQRLARPLLHLPLSTPPKIATFDHLEQVTFPHIPSLLDKITTMRKNPTNYDLIADFDHTLTQHRLGQQKCDSLFGMWARNEHVGAEFKKELFDSYKKYGPYQTDPTLSFEDKRKYVDKLYHIQRGLFQKHRIRVDQAAKVLEESQLVYRAYILELLGALESSGVKLHIISGGISDLIYSSLIQLAGRQRVDEVIRVHSNSWQLYSDESSPQSSLLRFVPPSIHSYNKHLIMKQYPLKRQHCLLLGDLKSDIYMAQDGGYKTVISIFYGKEGEFDQRALAQSKFDVIIEGDSSHKIVVEIIKIINGDKNVDWSYLYRLEPLLTNIIH